MFKLLNDIGWVMSIVILVGAIIFYVYEKITRED
jgi:hypothetical protein